LDTIIVKDLAVAYCVGVPETERSHPQRLLLTLELTHDFSAAAAHDDLTHTINYYAVCQRLLRFGDGRSWKLIETLAVEIAELLCSEFEAATATVEVKKFIIPEAGHVAVRVTRGTL
jgi:dihydroneopterin aldolase